jgi:hypothetical protein
MSSEEARSGSSRVGFSDQDLLDAIRTVSNRVSGRLKFEEYEARRDDDHPSGYTIADRLGWANACEQAGVECHGPRNEVEWTVSASVKAVAECIFDHGGNISTEEYSEWARGRSDVPSARTVKTRVGKWTEAKRRAFELLEQRPAEWE